MNNFINTNVKSQYREIKVIDLPDCYHKSCLVSFVKNLSATVIVVAKLVNIRDWAGYIGWPSLENMQDDIKDKSWVSYYCSSIRTPEQVEAYGDILSREAAEEIFPEWRDKRYRS